MRADPVAVQSFSFSRPMMKVAGPLYPGPIRALATSNFRRQAAGVGDIDGAVRVHLAAVPFVAAPGFGAAGNQA